MRSVFGLIVIFLKSLISVNSQAEVMRCFDCNSGGTGFGNAICPPNGNLKQEVLTTVRCSERCFSRTVPEKPGVVQRGCSSGIGFFLSRPLPEDGCVNVNDDNWWCFCATSLCNIDDMTQYGNGAQPINPVTQYKTVTSRQMTPVTEYRHSRQPDPVTQYKTTRQTSPIRPKTRKTTLAPWTRAKKRTRTTTSTTTTTTTPKPEITTRRSWGKEVITDWTPRPTPASTTEKKPRETSSKRDHEKPAMERDSPRGQSAELQVSKEVLEPSSYEDPMDEWQVQYEASLDSSASKDEDFYRELPFDRHYAQHTHNEDR